ncbi:MAG: polyprenyl synthetase family protein [Anaerolineae bacterium]
MTQDQLGYRSLLRDDLGEIGALMLEACSELPRAIRLPVEALINRGGKRLRPALVLLSSYMYEADHNDAVLTATAIEMLHTATLIHDDFIDKAEKRRGVTTLNATQIPAATVLTGDLIFAEAARLIAHTNNTTLVTRFAETLSTICSGELHQLFEGRKGQLPTEEAYYDRIFAKTASLFALATESGAILSRQSVEEVSRSRKVGELLGEAFQIADDVLDIAGDAAILGKPVGNDIRQGIITLPVLLYSETHPHDDRVRALLNGGVDTITFDNLLQDLRASGAGDRAMIRATSHVASALDLLRTHPDSPYRRAMEEIATFAVNRES